jgi:hypothetical protein
MEVRNISATNMAKKRGFTTYRIFKALIDEGFINPLEEGPKKVNRQVAIIPRGSMGSIFCGLQICN